MVTTNSSLQPSPQYVTHIISRSAAELWPTYHTTLVESLHSDSRAYLFARFAWAILFRIKLFVTAGRHRHVIRLYRDQTGVIEYKTEYCTGTELQNADGGGGSKTATPLNPRKRNSRKVSIANRDADFVESSENSDTDMEDTDFWDGMDHRGERGNRRKQESSEESAPDTKACLAPEVEADLRATLRKVMTQQQEAESKEDSREVEMTPQLK